MSENNAIKNYQEHLHRIKSCSNSWRIMERNDFKCKNPSPNQPKYKVVPIRCGSKSCKYCLGLEVKKIRSKLFNIQKLHRLRFFTLSIINDERTEAEKLAQLTLSFRKLTLILRKTHPSIKYFYIIERSPNGFWHIHGLWNIYIPVKDLSELWKKVSPAYRVWLEKVKSEKGIVKYLADYLTKSGINKPEKKVFYETRKRQYNSSRGFFTKNTYKSIYDLYSNENYSTEELKKEIYTLLSEKKLYSEDISFYNYPYSDDLLSYIYYSIYCEPDEPELNFGR